MRKLNSYFDFFEFLFCFVLFYYCSYFIIIIWSSHNVGRVYVHWWTMVYLCSKVCLIYLIHIDSTVYLLVGHKEAVLMMLVVVVVVARSLNVNQTGTWNVNFVCQCLYVWVWTITPKCHLTLPLSIAMATISYIRIYSVWPIDWFLLSGQLNFLVHTCVLINETNFGQSFGCYCVCVCNWHLFDNDKSFFLSFFSLFLLTFYRWIKLAMKECIFFFNLFPPFYSVNQVSRLLPDYRCHSRADPSHLNRTEPNPILFYMFVCVCVSVYLEYTLDGTS